MSAKEEFRKKSSSDYVSAIHSYTIFVETTLKLQEITQYAPSLPVEDDFLEAFIDALDRPSRQTVKNLETAKQCLVRQIQKNCFGDTQTLEEYLRKQSGERNPKSRDIQLQIENGDWNKFLAFLYFESVSEHLLRYAFTDDEEKKLNEVIFYHLQRNELKDIGFDDFTIDHAIITRERSLGSGLTRSRINDYNQEIKNHAFDLQEELELPKLHNLNPAHMNEHFIAWNSHCTDNPDLN